MKGLIFGLVLMTISGSSSSQTLGGMLGRAADALGGKANCTATYSVSQSGVFGKDTSTQTKDVSGRSTKDACQKAKKENDSDSGVFGNSTKYLSELSCTIKNGVSVRVDVETCDVVL